MHALGTHLLVELRDCNPAILQSLEAVKETLVSAAREAKATIVDISFHEFNPFGISGMVVIAESHLSIHTWPEFGYAAVDVFTCSQTTEPMKAYDTLVALLKPKSSTVMELKR